MITAGLMGYFNIPLKASTALIFSITFGISVDNSIRFLAKYRQEILPNNFFIPVAVSESILETGKSITHTHPLCCLRVLSFSRSSFGGTIALGLLTSTTLVISCSRTWFCYQLWSWRSTDRRVRRVNCWLMISIQVSMGSRKMRRLICSKIKIHSRNASRRSDCFCSFQVSLLCSKC